MAKRHRRTSTPEPATAPQPQAGIVQRAARYDGWTNLLNGMGIQGRDRSMATGYVDRGPLAQAEQTALYRDSWVARRIVDLIAEDCTRAGVALNVDEDDDAADLIHEIDEDLRRLSVTQQFANAKRWANVYGGAVIVLATNDGNLIGPDNLAMAEPLREDQLTSIDGMLVVDRRYAIPELASIDRDPKSPTWLLPQIYYVTPLLPGGGTFTIAVHASRLLRIDGAPIDNLTRIGNLTWGDSLYQSLYDPMRQYGATITAMAATAQTFTQGVMSVRGLDAILASNDSGALLNRLSAFNLALSTSGMAITDVDGEEYQRMGSPVSGLPELIDRQALELCGALGVPKSRFFGNQSGTLAGAEEDHTLWAERIAGEQSRTLQLPMQRLVRLLAICRMGTTDVPSIGVTFNPIYVADPKKQAETRKIIAETDQIYYGMNAVEPAEIRASRFGGSVFGVETILDPGITASLEAQGLGPEAEAPEPEVEGESVAAEQADAADADTYTPPAAVAAAAKRGLELRASLPPSRRGGTAVGVKRASQLANRQPVSLDVIKRMVSFFARHEVDKQGEGWGKDSKGYQAWLLWGGDPGRRWAEGILRRARAGE